MNQKQAPRARSGGGATSNQVVRTQEPKAAPRTRAISPEGAAQIGVSTAFKKAPLDMGRGYSPPVGPTNLIAQGAGAGRTVMRAGSQSPTPAPTQYPRPADKSEWPDKGSRS
jgi:hypothetical protein